MAVAAVVLVWMALFMSLIRTHILWSSPTAAMHVDPVAVRKPTSVGCDVGNNENGEGTTCVTLGNSASVFPLNLALVVEYRNAWICFS